MDLSQRLKEAADPTTSPERLAELAGDRSEMVRWRVARNSATPKAVVDRLTGDKSEVVRLEAGNESIRRTHPR